MVLKTDIGQDLCQISLTGLRALTLLGLLIQAPRSLEEIKQEFVKYKITEESNSYDILRIDLNTLKLMGCEISRADKRTNNKYVLLSHPFELDIDKNDISILKKTFTKIKESANIKLLIQYYMLFKKLSEQTSNVEIKEQLLGISPLKKYDLDKINEIQEYCENKKTLNILYKTPVKNVLEEKAVVAQELVFKNDKLYLYGYDKSKKESVILNLKRILKIISTKDDDNSIDAPSVKIRFKLTNFGVAGLGKNESIISGDFENGFIIEGVYHNDFVATQRILSFGASCTVYEPQDFKEHIVELLRKMRNTYNG